MSGFLIDTNVLSEFSRRGEPDTRVKQWLEAAATESLYASVITFGEIRRGIDLLPPSKRRAQLEEWLAYDLPEWFENRILPVDKEVADRWGHLSARAQLNGTPLATADGLLAATAVEYELVIVTRNAKGFANVDVRIFNPWKA